jgi:hypothetical protein
MNHSPKLAVNFGKEQYISLIPGWRTCLLLLQGFAPVRTPIDHPLFGSWRGDEVHLVTAGRTRQPQAVVEHMALQALQGSNSDDTAYMYLGCKFRNLTREVAELVAATPELQEYCFQEMAVPDDYDYSWLTPHKLDNMLYGLKTPMGPQFFHQYVLWLGARPGLPPEVKEILRREANKAAARLALAQSS